MSERVAGRNRIETGGCQKIMLLHGRGGRVHVFEFHGSSDGLFLWSH